MPLSRLHAAFGRPWRPFVERLRELQADMDRAWEETAAAAGFVCRGCPDNCCHTLFHHHTLIEWLDLCDGLAGLSPEACREVRRRAAAGDAPCPLLHEERCRLYRHRPMICRLHGLPHRLQRPDGRVHEGPGCEAFHRRCPTPGRPLDRTPFYGRMAAIEKELRRAVDFPDRIRLTVAGMIRACPSGGGRGEGR